MQARQFKEQWERARAECARDMEAIEEAARRVEMSEFFDAFSERGAEAASGGGANGSAEAGPPSRGAPLRALREAFAAARLRRRVLWALCADAISRIEESLDAELRAALSAPGGHARAARALAEAEEEEEAESRGHATSRDAELVGDAADSAEILDGIESVSDRLDAEEGLRVCKQRLFSMRERARFVSRANAAEQPAEGRAWKFGCPRPLERPDSE